jgi:hypothetical protein
LALTEKGEVKIRTQPVPYKGTAVRWNVRTDVPDLIKRALVFGGREHEPAFDYVDKLGGGEGRSVRVIMKEQFVSLGSRDAGDLVSKYLSNILAMDPMSKVECDFSDVNIISSSFADEVFGRLFVTLGPMSFMSRVSVVNAESDIVSLIDRAILQRSQATKA